MSMHELTNGYNHIRPPTPNSQPVLPFNKSDTHIYYISINFTQNNFKELGIVSD